MRWETEIEKQICLNELEEIKDKFDKKNGLNKNELTILNIQAQNGNSKAIFNLQWVNAIEKRYRLRRQYILENIALEDLDFDYSFESLGTLPHGIEDIMNLDSSNRSILIVELLWDIKDLNINNEWMVLYNPTDKDISLDDCKIQTAGEIFINRGLLTGVIKAKDYYIVVGKNITYTKEDVRFDFDETLSPVTSGVRIKGNNDEVLDTALFNIPVGAIPDSITTVSLMRNKSNGEYIDTNYSAKDFSPNFSPSLENYRS